MTRRKARLLTAALAAAVALFFTLRAVRAAPHLVVTIAPVTLGPIERQILTTGTLQAVTAVEIGTQVSGTVQTLGADYNSIVGRGQILARLDPAAYDAALEGARAALAQATADLDSARDAEADTRTKLERARALAAGDLITASDLSDAVVAHDTAAATVKDLEAQVAQAQAGVQQASVTLAHTIIRSPIDGIVIARNVDVGQTVAASVQTPVMFVLANDLRHLQLQATIDEADVGGVSPGEDTVFTVDAYPDMTFHGVITQIRLQPLDESGAAPPSPTPGPTPPTGTVVAYTAVVGVNNPDERLRPGMTATIIMRGWHKDAALRIPNNALSFEPAENVLAAAHGSDAPPPAAAGVRAGEVWTYDGRRFTAIAVRTGLADDRWTESLGATLSAGDALVTRAVLQR